MKVLFLYQYFTTPKGRYSTRAYEFARRWVSAGADVTVLTSQYDKSDLDTRRWLEQLEIEGIDVRVVNLRVSNQQSFLFRVATFGVYSVVASFYALTTKADVLLCSSGPLFVGIPGLLARWLRGKPFIFEVRDLWPEGAVQLGVIRHPILIKLSRWLEKLCYRNASAVVALSPDSADWIREIANHTRVRVIPNACDNELAAAFEHSEGGEPGRALKGVYAGSLGKMNDSFQLLEIATALDKNHVNCVIDVYGEGADLDELRRAADKRGLNNLDIHEGVPKRVVFAALQKADFALLIFRDVPVMDSVSPNKMFDALASGVPIIQSTQGWIKKMLAEHDCGVTVARGDAEATAAAIASLYSSPKRLAEMSANAKRVAREQFDRSRLAEEYLALLRESTGGRVLT